MKKNLLLVLSSFIWIIQAQAQNAATPNPGFENWTQVGNYWNPNGWNNLNSQTAIIGVFTCTRATAPADVHSGSLAIKLTTKSVFGITANGIASTATLVTTPPYGVTGGINYTERPDSITGWFKYTPANSNDSGFVQFVLLGSANDTIGFVKFNTPNTPVTSYTRFSKPITYFSSATPAKSYWILSSSDGANPVVNSSIIIDDLDLVFNPGTSLPEQQEQLPGLVSNLVNDHIVVRNFSGRTAELDVLDCTGKLVATYEVSEGVQHLPAYRLHAGIYIYRFKETGSGQPVSGKLIRY